MAEPQLSVRSARARDLAHRLAQREKRTVAQVVERALEVYAAREAGRQPAAEFYASLRAPSDEEDIDLEAVIREARRPHHGIDL
ncbi:plasmid stabilization protein [Bosea sp. (in: a-proteobacteria)]|uniref:plasmid stabilization protein n=1 Tax=Bosea sp. (in: a-proteobacteria) TaxID=1871050 RepID=UPI003F7153E1